MTTKTNRLLHRKTVSQDKQNSDNNDKGDGSGALSLSGASMLHVYFATLFALLTVMVSF